MSVKERLINDINYLPEHTLQAISIIVNEIKVQYSNNKAPAQPHPVYGSGKGKMWIADDFDAPLFTEKHFPKP